MLPINVGIIGLGNVGGGTLRILADNAREISRKLGRSLCVRALCSRSIEMRLPPAAEAFPGARRTNDWRQVVGDPNIDIVVELIGGLETAHEIARASIRAGKSIVTANKELMALHGPDLWAEARRAGVRIAMEASVCGGIPIHNVLREGIAGDRIQALLGILNGTSNYILSEMERRGETLGTVLAEAQSLGYAEADPTADVDGYDARSKLSILAALAFGVRVAPHDIPTEGIRRIREIDFIYAARLGCTIRLIGSAAADERGLFLSVRPALLPRSVILASVSGSYNAVWVRGAHGDDTFYYGRGAGPTPTGVAVVSDLMNIGRELASEASPRVSPFAHEELEEIAPASLEEEVRPYYLRFRVRDRPGIVARLAGILADLDVSIDALLQEPGGDKKDLPFVITTDPAAQRAIRHAVDRMCELDFLVEAPLVLPLERGLAAL